MAEVEDAGCSCCAAPKRCVPDFGRPTRFEACYVTQASLYVSLVFWVTALVASIVGHSSTSILENCLESALDLASTAVVLYRLAAPDALLETARNTVLEKRISFVLGSTMILLGTLFIAFAVNCLIVQTHSTEQDMAFEIVISVPSAILYLIVGMMQLQMSWVLNLRSLKQDAIISILGAVVAMGSLIAALVNMIMWIGDDPHGSTPKMASRIFSQLANETAAGVLNATLVKQRQRMEYQFRFWWLEDVFSVFTATILLGFGFYFVVDDTLNGSKWWRPSFWLDPLPPKTNAPPSSSEKTPLKPPR